jgi:SAM-dependent methyltransferase
MKHVDFDDFAADYNNIHAENLRFFETESDYFAQYKAKIAKNLINVDPARILEFGCGIGNNIKYLKNSFPDAVIAGCDISQKSIDLAAQQNPEVEFVNIEGLSETHFGSYDLVFIANVFHHIQPEQRINTMLLLKKLLKKDGRLIIFEHNPYNPITRHIVNTCPFDADAKLLKPKELSTLLNEAGFSIMTRNYILFFTSFLACLRPFERYMTSLPLGGQYVILASV